MTVLVILAAIIFAIGFVLILDGVSLDFHGLDDDPAEDDPAEERRHP